jgi:hypothetical protein
MKVGDMVVIVKVDQDSPGYIVWGIREGMTGTIHSPYSGPERFAADWVVKVPVLSTPIFAPEAYLRKIDPPQRCEEDFDWRRVGDEVSV